jgi:hypothetical protein
METPRPATPVVILHTPLSDPSKLEQFVEDCWREGVRLIAVAGPDADLIEDTIDEIVVGDATQDDRFVVTSNHAGEPIEDVLLFAASWEGGSKVKEVRL